MATSADGHAPTPVRLTSRILAVVRRLFAPVALLFLAVAAYSSRDVFVQILAQARLAPLLATVVLWASLHLLIPVIAARVFHGFALAIPYRTALRIHVERLPARYLPGGIWQTVSRMADFHTLGANRSQLSVLVVMENVAPFATALISGAVCLWLAQDRVLPLPAIAAAGLLIVLLLPWVLHRTIPQASLPLPAYLAAVGASIAFWAGAALAFVVYWSALPSAGLEEGPYTLAGTYLLSWAAGFLAVFAPQGLGVFEAVAGLLLRGDLSFAGMALLVAGFRAATIAGDGLAYSVGMLLQWMFRKRRGITH